MTSPVAATDGGDRRKWAIVLEIPAAQHLA